MNQGILPRLRGMKLMNGSLMTHLTRLTLATTSTRAPLSDGSTSCVETVITGALQTYAPRTTIVTMLTEARILRARQTLATSPRRDRRKAMILTKTFLTLSLTPSDRGLLIVMLPLLGLHPHLARCHVSSTLLQRSLALLPLRSACRVTHSTVKKMRMIKKTKMATVTTIPPLGGMARLFNRGES